MFTHKTALSTKGRKQRRLTPDQRREVVRLWEAEAGSQVEIAEAYGVSPTAVHYLVHSPLYQIPEEEDNTWEL